MPFDSLTACAAAHECQCLIGGKITKIHQPDKYTAELRLYTPGGNQRLILSAHPVFGRMQITTRPSDNPAKPPLFCMVLRKHLDGARLTALQQDPYDRVLRLDFAAYDEVGTPTERSLILEIMGKHSNLILLDTPTGRIIDAIRRYSHNVSRHREVLPGVTYCPPPQDTRPAWGDTDAESFAAAIYAGDLDLPPHRLLQSTFRGLSPFLAQEICYRAGLADMPDSTTLGVYDINNLYYHTQDIQKAVADGDFLGIILQKDGQYQDYYPLRLHSHPADQQEELPTISQALDKFYQTRADRQLFDNEQTALHRLLTREEQRLRKKIKLEEKDYEEAAKAEQYKEKAELLMAYLHTVTQGEQTITLPSFYQDGVDIRISLRPDLSPVDNAKRYFHRYNKAKNAERQISRQLELNRSELTYIESLLQNLTEAETLSDLMLLQAELRESNYLKPLKNTGKKPTLRQPDYKRFRTSDGFEVWLGRSNKQNDRLTTRMADRDDIWLHTQKIPGSHVILRHRPGCNITDCAIAEAAALAALHSKARDADKVPVDYTTIANVHKPNGAKPGMVIYTDQQTIYVQPHTLPEITDNDADE